MSFACFKNKVLKVLVLRNNSVLQNTSIQEKKITSVMLGRGVKGKVVSRNVNTGS